MTWHRDMGRETSIDSHTVTGHFLGKTTIASTGRANRTIVTRHDRRYNYLFPDPVAVTGNNFTADFVTQCQRRFINGRYPLIKVPDVSVANTAAGNFDQYFSRFQLGNI